MAEHDYVIANQNGANTRSDLNNALAAIVSNNSKATAPTTTYAFMWWADTANDILKQRNAADSAWISILTLSTGAPLGTLGLDSSGGVARATSGLLFNGDTAAANALDDYEEGTFTAVVTMGSGTAPMDTNFDRLVYTKIGRQVHISGQFRFGTVSSPSGSFSLSLPFAAAEQEEYAEIGTGTFRAYQVTIPATAVSPATTFSPGGGSSMQFQWSVNNSVATNAIATSNGYYSIGVTYYT